MQFHVWVKVDWFGRGYVRMETTSLSCHPPLSSVWVIVLCLVLLHNQHYRSFDQRPVFPCMNKYRIEFRRQSVATLTWV